MTELEECQEKVRLLTQAINDADVEIFRLKAVLRMAILDTKRVTNYQVVAKDTYKLSWSDRTRKWAALCDLDLDEYNPWNSKPK